MKTDLERLLEKIIKQPNGCWEWQNATDSWGYGNFYYNFTMRKAHRVSFMLHKGKIPKGLLVLHTCDNPPCINPELLFLGTNKTNSDDKIAKGRNVNVKCVGEQNRNAKIKEQQVKEIRALSGILSTRFLAKYYSVDTTAINKTNNGTNWSNIPNPTEDEIRAIRTKFSTVLFD